MLGIRLGMVWEWLRKLLSNCERLVWESLGNSAGIVQESLGTYIWETGELVWGLFWIFFEKSVRNYKGIGTCFGIVCELLGNGLGMFREVFAHSVRTLWRCV